MLKCKEGPLCEQCPKFEKGVEVADRYPIAQWSGLVLCGEGPGVNEVVKQICFVGQSGWLMEKTAKAVRADIDSAWITNAAKCGLKNGKKLSDKLEAEAARCCAPIFEQNLRELMLDHTRPPVVLCLGKVAWEALSGIKGIMEYRGSIVPPSDAEPWYLVATIHPAAMMRKEEWRPIFDQFCADLRHADQLARGHAKLFQPDIQPADFDDVMLLLDEARSSLGPLGLDVETHSGPGLTGAAGDIMTCELTCIGVAYDDEAYCIPMQYMAENYYTKEQLLTILTTLEEILAIPSMKVVFHNMLFDVPVLERCLPLELERLK